MVRIRIAAVLSAAFMIGVMTVTAAFAQGGSVQQFVPGFEDLPLMPGLEATRDAGMVFDKPHGRIVQAVATGPVRRDAVVAFYAETLPQLGWVAQGKHSYRREGELLQIEFESGNGTLTVRFFLSPG